MQYLPGYRFTDLPDGRALKNPVKRPQQKDSCFPNFGFGVWSHHSAPT
jgi:hypothetical protein